MRTRTVPVRKVVLLVVVWVTVGIWALAVINLL